MTSRNILQGLELELGLIRWDNKTVIYRLNAGPFQSAIGSTADFRSRSVSYRHDASSDLHYTQFLISILNFTYMRHLLDSLFIKRHAVFSNKNHKTSPEFKIKGSHSGVVKHSLPLVIRRPECW